MWLIYNVLTADMSQWSSGSMSDCSARGPGIESRCGQMCLSHNHCDLQPWARAVCNLPAVPRSTQPSSRTWDGKRVSVFQLSNNNKRCRWLQTIAAYRRTDSPSQVAWSEGRQPLVRFAAFIRRTEWTLAMTFSGHYDGTINIVLGLLLS